MDIFDLLLITVIFLLGFYLGAAIGPSLKLRYRRAGPRAARPQSCPGVLIEWTNNDWPPQRFAQPPIDGDIRQRGGDLYVSLRDRIP